MGEGNQLRRQIPEALAGHRLDQALSELFPEYSRSRLKQWIESGQAQVEGRQWRPKDKVLGGEWVDLEAEVEAEERWEPQEIALQVIYEDEWLLVIDKPAGMVVHPAAGNPDGTLLNALLHYAPEVAVVPRAGIVHRLDKETTGLLVVARTLEAQHSLVEQLQARTLTREYDAVAVGVMTGGGTVDAPIGRHSTDRQRQAVTFGGKPAVTHYRVVERFRAHTHVKVRLETGRTHQIRVHLAHIHFPLVGDPVYGGRVRVPPGASPELMGLLRSFPRQALHAKRLGLNHPGSGEYMEWESPLLEDMARLLAALRADAREHGEWD